MDVLLNTSGRRRVKHLLLFYLFVVKAAADCPKPQGRESIVLTNKALLMNDFPEGSEVTFECAHGHVEKSGSKIATCVNGNWTEPDLICEKKDCGPPTPQPNMSFNTSSGTLFGAVARVVCDKGYQVSGPSYKQCYATGWSGRSKCEIVTCDVPQKVDNGRILWDSQDDPKYGEMIQYVCNEGHTLVGNGAIMCTETGAYDSQPPECQGVTIEVATKMVTTTSPPPAQEASTSAAFAAATPTAHRDKPVTTSETSTVSPTPRGGVDILTAEDEATTASVTSTSSFQDELDGIVDTNKDVGYTPVILSVLGVTLGACIFALFLHKYLLKRKGSYDTREDLKPELLQFQNL